MSHEIFIKYFIEYLFFCSTHGFDIELYDILYSILCKLYILRIGVLDCHIHCARVWYEIIKIVAHSLTFIWDPASASMKLGMYQVIIFDWYRILFWNFEICTTSLFSFGWLYTLRKNKHQISLYLGLKKVMAIILQITFSNGFSFKKITVCTSACHTFFHYVPIMVSSWNFQEWLPITEVMSMQKFKVWGQKSRLQRSKPKLAVSGP